MATDLDSSFSEQYMNINAKLKKRFMRKPNISEATNEFVALAIQCENSDQPTFAGHSYIGAAKCEALAGNFLGEAEHYIAAARQFMKAEQKLKSLKFYSPDRENLEAAIGCYMQAFNKYPEKSSLRSSIIIEIAKSLIDLNQKIEALAYYEQALNIIEDKTFKLTCMNKLLCLQIDCGKFNDALDTANKICDSNFTVPDLLLADVQISRVLLTLIVQPDEEQRPESLKKLFEDLLENDDYGDDNSKANPFNVDITLKLQSIIVCCATNDLSSVIAVSADAKQFMNSHQKDLLDELVNHKRLVSLSLI